MTAPIAEKQVVGCCLTSQDLCGRAADMTAADFTCAPLGMIFDATQADGVTSLSTVAAHLESKGILDTCFGEAGLARLVADADVSAFAGHRESVIAETRKRAILQRLQSAGLGSIPAADIPGAVAELVAGLEADASDRPGASGTSSVDATRIAMEGFFKRAKRESLPGNPTNIPGLNLALDGGFQGGQLIVLGAASSVGKTAEGLNILDTVSVGLGIPTLVFSLEMSPEQNTGRLIVGRSVAGGREWKRGSAQGGDLRSFMTSAARIANSPITWGDATTLGGMIAEMTAWARNPATLAALESAKTKHADAAGNQAEFFLQVMIDHLHILPNTTKMIEKDWLAHATKTLKAVALKKLGVPIIALAQLNRASVREKRPPRKDDLRGGGGIEENSDVIILIDRDPKGERPHEGTMILEKNREGELVNIPVHWDGRNTKYTERVADGWGEQS